MKQNKKRNNEAKKKKKKTLINPRVNENFVL